MHIPVLIPAYNPDQKLLSVVEDLIRFGFDKIIIVNDGSDSCCRDIFKKLENMEFCHVLHHAVNLGKGRALKTGFNYFYLNFHDAQGIVTADADGQHLAEDIRKVVLAFLENPHNMVIGSRVFAGDTPLRSRLGNIITRYVFRFLVGKKLSDTQTGLRCIPRDRIPEMIRLEGEKYEYEMNMLISTKTSHIDIIEKPIATVYIENNKSSHFNPLIDSMKIYFLLMRFFFSSSITTIIDFLVFILAFKLTEQLSVSIILSRFIASLFNFTFNRSVVFHNKAQLKYVVIRYYLLLIMMSFITFLAIRAAVHFFGFNVIIAKVFVESLLFIASFVIQRDLIFAPSPDQRNV